jgi:hypothetical protein
MSDGNEQLPSELGFLAANAADLPETPHELPIDRAKVDALLDRIRQGETVDLLEEFLAAVNWRAGFRGTAGGDLGLDDIARLTRYYREKFADVGPLYLAELFSTEFMTEQRARGDVRFSDKLLTLGRTDPELWTEIRTFFRRKEFVTAVLAMAHRSEAVTPRT